MNRLVTLMALAMLVLPTPSLAASKFSLDTDLPPPEPISELDIGERPNFILSPGYWMWNGKNHVWQHSRWVEKREGYVWVPDQWQQRGNKWHLAPGHWVEDEDYEDTDIETVAQECPKKKPMKKAYKKRVRKLDERASWPSPVRR